jgi:hypothetical protein
MRGLLQEKGYVAPVDVLLTMGLLTKEDYEKWRLGQVAFLEKVCGANLSKLSTIMSCLRKFARTNSLKESFTFYGRWGRGPKIKLIFSKSRDSRIELHYATHFVKRDLKKEAPRKLAAGKAAADRKEPAKDGQESAAVDLADEMAFGAPDGLADELPFGQTDRKV